MVKEKKSYPVNIYFAANGSGRQESFVGLKLIVQKMATLVTHR
ncbi:hypothetical protein SLEP1_g16566 [Rubroshorea leprosula]|uniref:Uncharacterized protein n=1 Tax=Rubroshorea leprosula TaxID=152421 RepID=A0AAV5J0I6_9ROSI|nr:hypothetical protein SLEP1_g16566 [Rubroshorea leprosula]